MSETSAERTAMLRALELAAGAGPQLLPNPRVGCVLLAPDGTTIAEGRHRGPGTPHAEVEALTRAEEQAPGAARGATAVVTLEPCNHTGRTGPCAQALIAAGVARVVFAQADPNPIAAGGAATLRAAGIDVESGLLADRAGALNRAWTRAVELQRPFVTWKFATTLDGRSAAADGTSRWVSSRAARLDTHRLRAECDVMLVGARTVAVDDPELTVRDERDRPVGVQPLRVVVGHRDLPPTKRIFNDRGPSLQLRSHDPRAVLDELWRRERRHVFCEGGPTLAAAFLAAGVVDEIVVYVAPFLLGAGHSAVADLGITTIADAYRPEVVDLTVLPPDPGAPEGDAEQPNVRFTLEPRARRQ
ncbi:MAG: bifunctional diaminohydroxyphosphoribosylaminopyrimidine deaminase/5-amino-6-(5-phosphoribosylamino)uracil reductase RibD [Nocardioides sp.]|uniref:bifunctional diaminohydroxyphosphoribosylaminopyrimidine deaminase/5-amino-6-(5-phosphoribosylamino)uracil reductase RibD n=1 Tax=Nocardioides sp. TaxID=35761 RepID=UPI0039E4DA45